jgi:glycosyltransferase involved in cell wall biosynthesis
MQGPPAGQPPPPRAPAISIIIPAYGVAHLVGEALRSVQAQGFTDWEAIVVDDGAPDDVAGAVAVFAGDPRIRLLATDNRGVATARNRAISEARAPLIALLDGDDMFEPDYLATMVETLVADPRHGFATCDATFFGASRVGRRFSEYMAQDLPISLERVLDRRFNVFTASLLHKAAFDSVGGYDATLRSGEDFDLWVRLLEAGWTAAYVPRPLVRYRRRMSSLSMDTAPMLRAVCRVYAGSAARLAGRPEAAVANAMRARTEEEIPVAEGEALIESGRVREGLAALRRAKVHRRSLNWRAAMAFMTLLPMLARPLLRYRDRIGADAKAKG